MPPGRWSSCSALCGGWGLVVWWCLGARGFCWRCAGGARPRCGVGHGGFAAVGGRARCRVHVQHPWPPPWGGGPPPLVGGRGPPVGGRPSSCFGVGCVGFGPSAGSSPCWGGCGGCGGLFVICIVVASIFVVCARPPFLFCLARARGACGGACGPRGRPLWWWSWACFLLCVVLWGIRWMPWHQELMKDVAACDMPRGVGERALIRGCPNGGTRPGLCWATII